MALSGLDIYKLLPKTNCRECGFATCLAFAMQLAKKSVSIEKCPFINETSRKTLEESSLPPIRSVIIGSADKKIELGSEGFLFRHDGKFFNPCGIGFIVDDNLTAGQIEEKIKKINLMKFERVGQKLEIDILAVRQNSEPAKFIEALKIISRNTDLPLILISKQAGTLKEALDIVLDRKPVLYCTQESETTKVAELSKQHNLPMVICGKDLAELSALTKNLNNLGVENIILDTGRKPVAQKVWDLTQIRRIPLKKSDRSLGYPVLTIAEDADCYEEAIEAATYICKYSSLVLLKNTESYEALALLTLRQNIYSDPQKPLQIEPNVYAIGSVSEKSPILITTNFSLSYYTVLGEVEASKIPSYILSVDTEGMSVLTAWAAEKFTPSKITQSLDKFGVKNKVSHNQLVIPGYVAVMSGDLEEESGWKVTVGPKEAAGIPSFLRNL